MMMAATPPAPRLARSPLISQEMLPRSAGEAGVAGGSIRVAAVPIHRGCGVGGVSCSWPRLPTAHRRPRPRPSSLPGAPGCPMFPADSYWHARVDALPRDPRVGHLRRPTPARARRCTPTSAPGSTTAARSASRSRPSARASPRCRSSFEYADESDPGPYPIPPNAPIEGGAASSGDRHVLVVDRDACRDYELYAAYPNGGGTSWSAGLGRGVRPDARTRCGPRRGRAPTPPGCRSCPDSSATTRWRRARSTTRSGSRCAAPIDGTSGRRATRPGRTTRPRRRWARGCG